MDEDDMSRFQPNHIQHQIDTEVCSCNLCERVLQARRSIVPTDVQPELVLPKLEMQMPEAQQPYLIPYLEQFQAYTAGIRRKLRILIPPICVFDKSNPIYLVWKKKQYQPIEITRHHGILSCYDVTKFLKQGFIYTNRNSSQAKQKVKNQSIAVAKYLNCAGQLISIPLLQSLFRSKNKKYRRALHYIQCIVGFEEYREIRERLDINLIKEKEPLLYSRAKQEVTFLCDQGRRRDQSYVPEAAQAAYEQTLKSANQNHYLRYISLKLLLLHAYKTGDLFQNAVFIYVKSGNLHHLTDLKIGKIGNSDKVWGIIINDVEQKMQKRVSSILQLKQSVKDRYAHVENSPGANKLEGMMDELFDRQKSDVLGKIREKLKFKNETTRFLNVSLPQIQLKKQPTINKERFISRNGSIKR